MADGAGRGTSGTNRRETRLWLSPYHHRCSDFSRNEHRWVGLARGVDEVRLAGHRQSRNAVRLEASGVEAPVLVAARRA